MRAEDPAKETRRFVEMVASLDAGDETRITATVYGSTANKYQKSYKEIKDKCKMCGPLMEVGRQVSTKTVRGELSGAKVNSQKEIWWVWSQLMPEILEEAMGLHSDPEGGPDFEENASVQQVRAKRKQTEALLQTLSPLSQAEEDTLLAIISTKYTASMPANLLLIPSTTVVKETFAGV